VLSTSSPPQRQVALQVDNRQHREEAGGEDAGLDAAALLRLMALRLEAEAAVVRHSSRWW
jgi:hypothetical protein